MYALISEFFILFYDFVFLALIGVGLVFLSHFLNRYRNKEFLNELAKILNKRDNNNKNE